MERLLDRQDAYKGSPWQPWTQNRYTYVGNNPVNYTDPTGHVPCYTDSYYNDVYADMGIPGGGCSSEDYAYESGEGLSSDEVLEGVGVGGTFAGAVETILGETAGLGLKMVNGALSIIPPYAEAMQDYNEHGDFWRASAKFTGEMVIGFLGGVAAAAFVSAGVAGAATSGGASLWMGSIGAVAAIDVTNKLSSGWSKFVDSWYD